MKSKLVLCVAMLLVLWGLAGKAKGGTYDVIALGALPGAVNSEALAINASGQVVGYSDVGSIYRPHAVLWSGGTITDLGTDGGWGSVATGINAVGQIVGNIRSEAISGEYLNAFSYSNSTMTVMVYRHSWANGIDDSGNIVGSYQFSSGGFIWDGEEINPDNPSAHVIALQGRPNAIHSTEHIAGEYSGGSHQAALLHIGGPPTTLGNLPGGEYSHALAINASGQVVGWSHTATGGQHAVLWSEGTITDLTPDLEEWSFAHGINASGQIVGEKYGRAFVYSDGVLTDLNTLIPSTPGLTLSTANAINDAGQIVGVGINPDGQTRAFLLTPNIVPEPSTFVLLAAGAIGLLAWAWRRRR